MENNLVGVRKGAWTKEEDILLRDCIHKFGEGKWHLVPPRAGLNRCRKSCRLRWLNYLRPNLNRGFFSEDEVDLMVRLHKLLGNRWSLIAGRLPGRTANDVKNFWNTHISKKPPAAGESSRRGRKTITESNIIRPRPRTFSNAKPPAWSSKLTRSNSSTSITKPPEAHDDEPGKGQAPSPSPSLHDPTTSNEPRATLQEDLDECIRWWGDLLEMTENGGQTTPFLFSDDVPAMLPGGFSGGGSISSADREGVCGSLSLDGDNDMVWNLEQFIDQ